MQQKEGSEIIVSICCLIYNHAPYLRECFEGFVMQKTNFPIEILVHDDASKDGSQEIIKEYTAKYPTLFKPIYQKENQYSKGIGVSVTYQFPRAKGKYIALCEGDDYWTDPYKLQKQVDFLEQNPDFGLVAHRMKIYNQNTNTFSEDWLGHLFENGNKSYEIKMEEFFKIWANHPCTVMFRKSMYDIEDVKYYTYYRDVNMFFNILMHGRLICFSDCSAVYRIHEGGVWSMIPILKKKELDLKVHRELYNRYKIPFLKQMYIYQLKDNIRYIVDYEIEWNKMYDLYNELRMENLRKESYNLYVLFLIKKIVGGKLFSLGNKVCKKLKKIV